MFGRKKKSQAPENSLTALKDLPQDVEALRELQRFVQLENLDAWMQRMYQEQRRTRRFTLAFRFGLLAVLAAGVGNTTYLIYTLNNPAQSMDSEQHIAVVDVNSPIQARNGISANQIISGIRRALDNDATKALVLNINSPGGSPTESQRVYHALKNFRDRHDVPIVSYIRDMGASGAYYIAAGTDTIYASPSSIVGREMAVLARRFVV